MKLHISKELSFPGDAVTQTLAILAIRGAGKTHTASVFAEELAKNSLPFVVLDPTGAWWGLRAGKDGKTGGYSVYVIGGAHGIPLEPTAGRVIAEQVAIHPANYVIDLSHFESNSAQDRFAADFAESLYRIKAKHPTPLQLIIDEADAFVPQRPMPGQQRMLGAFEALVKRGRIHGIGVTLISQRAAVVNKNVLTQIECLILLRITGPQDRNAVEEWIRYNGTDEDRKMILSSLASLPRGEAWVWSPSWMGVLKKVHVRDRETFNSSATPKAGEKIVSPQLAPVDMDKLSTEIRATMEQAKANDPEELKREVRRLRAELAKKPQAPAVDPDEIKKLKSDIAILEREAEIADEKIKQQRKAIETARGILGKVFVDEPAEKESKIEIEARAAKAASEIGDKYIERVFSKPRVQPSIGTATPVRIRAGARRMLSVLIQWFPNSMSEGQVRSHAGLKKSGTYGTYKSDLLTAGLIERMGIDLVATQKAVDEYGNDIEDAPQTTDEVLAVWMPKLRAGAKRMLEVLIREKREMTDAELAELSGMTKSGTYGTYKSDLKAAKLIVTQSGYVAANKETLFL